MVRSLWMSAVASALLWLGYPANAQDGIAWTANLRTAQETAAREGKLILVHFYSDNCPPCRALERDVFPRSEVIAAIHRNYVPVKVHVDTAPQLATRFRIESWPTDLVLTAAGLEVTRMNSPKEPADYALLLEQVAFQTGIGAARGGDSVPYIGAAQSDQSEVALAAATTPMGQQPQANSQPFVPPAAGNVPDRTAPYDPRRAAAAGAATPPANPYAPQQGQQRPAAQGIPQQPSGAVAPNTAAFLQSAAARSATGAGSSVPPQAAPSASGAIPPAGRSIYDDPPQQTAPTPSIYAPSAGFANNPPGPSPQGSIYDPAARAQQQTSAAQTPWPAAPAPQQSQFQPPAQQQQPAQQASAQFQRQQFIEVSKAPPAAIDGFCPVTILESKRWHKGNVRFGAVHGGRTYLFSSEQAKQKFLADPQRYAPVLSGCDPVVFAETSQLIDGNHNIGLLIGGRTFFFTSEETRRRFELSPQAYVARAQQAISTGQLRTR